MADVEDLAMRLERTGSPPGRLSLQFERQAGPGCGPAVDHEIAARRVADLGEQKARHLRHLLRLAKACDRLTLCKGMRMSLQDSGQAA